MEADGGRCAAAELDAIDAEVLAEIERRAWRGAKAAPLPPSRT